MSEVALKGQRGFNSSFQSVTLIGGQLLAVLVVVTLQTFLNEAQLKAWGWRIPFVIGALTAVIAMLLRRTLQETTSAETRKAKGAGTIAELFRHHKAAFFTVLGYTAGGSLCFYTFTTYMQKYLVNTVGITIKIASHVMTLCLLLFMCLQPLFGALSDRIGRRNNMLLFGRLGARDRSDHGQFAQRLEPDLSLSADHAGPGDHQLLYLGRGDRESRDVPSRSPRARGGAGLCRCQRDVWRFSRIRRPGAEVHRSGEPFLLVRDGDDGRGFPGRPPAAERGALLAP
jgi:MFS family permease